jgi:hypothetical protein
VLGGCCGTDARHVDALAAACAAFAGERDVGGGLRTVKADVSEMSVTDGLRLAVEIYICPWRTGPAGS